MENPLHFGFPASLLAYVYISLLRIMAPLRYSNSKSMEVFQNAKKEKGSPLSFGFAKGFSINFPSVGKCTNIFKTIDLSYIL